MLEDGAPQTISSFQPVALPPEPPAAERARERPRVSSNLAPEAQQARTFLLVFDDIHLSPGLAIAAKAAVGEFLQHRRARGRSREPDRTSAGASWWNARMPEGRERAASPS